MHRSIPAVGLAAGLLALAVGAPPAAFAVGGGTDPVVAPPVYPTTTTPVAGWKLIGNLRRPPAYNDTYGVSAVLIAPRLVLASAHAAGEKGGSFTLPTGESAKFVANGVRPRQPRVGQNDFTADGNADISLQLLDRALPMPAGGFPLLLKDRLTLGLDRSLPGFVLWGGRGGTVGGKSLVGWSRPGGTLLAGYPRLSVIDGDSGSTGLLYRSATAQPMMAGVNTTASIGILGQGDVNFGQVPNGVTFNDPLVVSGWTSATRYPTVGDWLSAQLKSLASANRGLVLPTFTTLAQAGINVAALAPAAPEYFRSGSPTATSVQLAWDHSAETRIPRTGYRIYDSAQLAAPRVTTGTALTVTGLTAGKEHRFTIRAYNANGESADLRNYVGEDPATVTFARPVTGLSVTTRAADGSTTGEFGGGEPGADYCATATWAPSVADPGTTIDAYEVMLGAEFAGEVPASAASGGQLSIQRCGLSPSQLQTFTVMPLVAGAAGAPAAASATTPAGPAPGTR
ncbi:MAG: fibronectin type III domain-containing protein [Solirubrobacteraceae bacterium]|nr:fibronectin type III domain-containing protein [Solirubrobacteraceae bacterium]